MCYSPPEPTRAVRGAPECSVAPVVVQVPEVAWQQLQSEVAQLRRHLHPLLRESFLRHTAAATRVQTHWRGVRARRSPEVSWLRVSRNQSLPLPIRRLAGFLILRPADMAVSVPRSVVPAPRSIAIGAPTPFAATLLAAAARGFLVRRRASRFHRQHAASTRLQSHARGTRSRRALEVTLLRLRQPQLLSRLAALEEALEVERRARMTQEAALRSIHDAVSRLVRADIERNHKAGGQKAGGQKAGGQKAGGPSERSQGMGLPQSNRRAAAVRERTEMGGERCAVVPMADSLDPPDFLYPPDFPQRSALQQTTQRLFSRQVRSAPLEAKPFTSENLLENLSENQSEKLSEKLSETKQHENDKYDKYDYRNGGNKISHEICHEISDEISDEISHEKPLSKLFEEMEAEVSAEMEARGRLRRELDGGVEMGSQMGSQMGLEGGGLEGGGFESPKTLLESLSSPASFVSASSGRGEHALDVGLEVEGLSPLRAPREAPREMADAVDEGSAPRSILDLVRSQIRAEAAARRRAAADAAAVTAE